MVYRGLTALVLGVSAALPAAAQEATGWSVGLFALGNSNIYLGADTTARVLPDLSYSTDRFAISARGLRYTAFESGGGSFDLVVVPRFAPYDSSDSVALAGMDRDFTVDAGLAYSYAFGTGTIVQARLLQEITGEHDGQEIDLQLRQNLMDFGLPFGIMAGARWESADLANYLYGVRAAEAIVGRPAYAPGDTIVPYIGIGTRIPLGDRFSISGGVRAEFYGSDVTNSPIVEDDMAITGTLGLTLRF